MKICLIAPFNVLSQTEGASIRTFEIAKNLSVCGANVFVFHQGPQKLVSESLNFLSFKPISSIPNSGNYFFPINIPFLSQFSAFIRKYNPDIVQCEQPWSTFPTLFLLRKFQIPIVLDEHNVESYWSMNASKVPLLFPFTFVLEKIAASNSLLILTTSEVDKGLIIKLYRISSKNIAVVPNGVSVQRFSNISSTTLQWKKVGFGSKPIVLFHGLMSAKQNYDAANQIIDFIAPKFPDSQFVLIGKNAPRWLEMKAKRQENISFLGYVPKIEQYIMAADVCIAPIMSGSGTRLKLLEYLAAGKPIVSTYKAAEGLPLTNFKNALLAKSVTIEFISLLSNMLRDHALAESLGKSAKQLAKSFDWKEIAADLYHKYEIMLENYSR